MSDSSVHELAALAVTLIDVMSDAVKWEISPYLELLRTITVERLVLGFSLL